METLAIQSVPLNQLDVLLRWVHPQTPLVELESIANEYRSRLSLCPPAPPMRVIQNGRPIVGGYFSCLPGDLAMLGGIRAETGAEALGVQLLQSQIAQLRERNSSILVQAAIAISDLATQRLILLAGFQPLTMVDQLWAAPASIHQSLAPSVDNIRWQPAHTVCRDRFCKLINDTFIDTLDCPELNSIRAPAQVLQSFLMGRPFRECPDWLVLLADDRLAGCLLLHRHNAELVELVYMGLAPWARRRGLGQQMVQAAHEYAVRLQASMIVLAVDIRNAPARKVYEQNGFQFHQRLQVFLNRY